MKFYYSTRKNDLVKNISNPRGIFSWGTSRDPDTGEEKFEHEYDLPSPAIESMVQTINTCEDFLQLRTQSAFKDEIDRNVPIIYNNIMRDNPDPMLTGLIFEKDDIRGNLRKLINACDNKNLSKWINDVDLYRTIQVSINKHYPEESQKVKNELIDSVYDAVNFYEEGDVDGVDDAIRADIIGKIKNGENPITAVSQAGAIFTDDKIWKEDHENVIKFYPGGEKEKLGKALDEYEKGGQEEESQYDDPWSDDAGGQEEKLYYVDPGLDDNLRIGEYWYDDY